MVDLNSPILAINGGRPVRTRPWKSNKTTGLREAGAAFRVVSSGKLSLFEGAFRADDGFSFLGGPEVISLEEEWSEYYGTQFSVSMNSATSGLYAAIGALELGFGDEVIVSPYTMTACATAPLIYGAIPVFADVDEATGCLSAKSIRERITAKTRAVIVVHQFGFAANMPEIMEIAREFDLRVIEDCAQAHGAKIAGKFVGTWGDIGVFSLNVNKTIQSGEGGVCITQDSEVAFRLRLIRNHGEAVVKAAQYENTTNIIGFNYRMTEVTAAIARHQLRRLDKLNQRRVSLVERLTELLGNFEFLEIMGKSATEGARKNSAEYDFSSHYLFVMKFWPKIADISRDEFVRVMRSEGIHFGAGYVEPLYLQPHFAKKTAFRAGFPYSAKVNEGLGQQYSRGLAPVAEKLHFQSLVSCEFIRPPHRMKDMKMIQKAIHKLFPS